MTCKHNNGTTASDNCADCERDKFKAEVEQLKKIVGIRENSAHFQWAKGRIDELEVTCIANGAFIKELEAEVVRLTKEVEQYDSDNLSANPGKWHIRGDDYQKVRNENKRLEAEVAYEQQRNQNNVAMADERIKELETELASLQTNYYELLYAVGEKIP